MELSHDIEKFLTACDECNKIYKIYFEIVGECDKKTTDYLHALELDELTYHQKARLTIAQKDNLKQRREAKNIIEQYEPLRKFLNDQVNLKFINLLKQTLGEVRKVEKYHGSRTYKKRT